MLSTTRAEEEVSASRTSRRYLKIAYRADPNDVGKQGYKAAVKRSRKAALCSGPLQSFQPRSRKKEWQRTCQLLEEAAAICCSTQPVCREA